MAGKRNWKRIALLTGALVVALLVTFALTVEPPIFAHKEEIVDDKPPAAATPTPQALPSTSHPALIPYDFSLATAGGGAVLAFTKLVAETRLVVYTWETDCPVCGRQLPYIAKLAGDLDPTVAQLVSISAGDTEEETVEFAHDREFEFPVLWAYSGEKDMAYFEPGVPCLFVFEVGGRLLGTVQNLEGEEFLAAVGELLNSK